MRVSDLSDLSKQCNRSPPPTPFIELQLLAATRTPLSIVPQTNPPGSRAPRKTQFHARESPRVSRFRMQSVLPLLYPPICSAYIFTS